ncbi:hypothetical protein MB84_31395 (plasmid) [Pandoraea oxalativorans]|uniref:IstB-like ATP-binding domain-containing protein n=1 Tax=Pandoraea oxalativorans TaxID=573737 RepID=A0A192B0S2_9BURK|nr:hypothetical protein MB84_31395 [Pandoraea oxalativorans]
MKHDAGACTDTTQARVARRKAATSAIAPALIERAENVGLPGPSGAHKTHLACALASGNARRHQNARHDGRRLDDAPSDCQAIEAVVSAF